MPHYLHAYDAKPPTRRRHDSTQRGLIRRETYTEHERLHEDTNAGHPTISEHVASESTRQYHGVSVDRYLHDVDQFDRPPVLRIGAAPDDDKRRTTSTTCLSSQHARSDALQPYEHNSHGYLQVVRPPSPTESESSSTVFDAGTEKKSRGRTYTVLNDGTKHADREPFRRQPTPVPADLKEYRDIQGRINKEYRRMEESGVDSYGRIPHPVPPPAPPQEHSWHGYPQMATYAPDASHPALYAPPVQAPVYGQHLLVPYTGGNTDQQACYPPAPHGHHGGYNPPYQDGGLAPAPYSPFPPAPYSGY